MIEINGLHKTFGKNEVLRHIHFTFEKGKVYGIVGCNGSGKTTLFRCIAGIEKHSGKIQSDWIPLKKYLGFLSAEPYFIPKITGEEYVYLLSEARGIKIKNIETKNIFELPLKQYIHSYSTGMKKKLALTAVLLQNNECFIFDEPYSGLDLQSTVLLTEIIRRLKSLNKTILLSSHVFSTLADSCDEIILLEDGSFQQSIKREGFDKLKDEIEHKVIKKDIDAIFSVD